MALPDIWAAVIGEVSAPGFNQLKGIIAILILAATYMLQRQVLTRLWRALRSLAEKKLVGTELDDRFVEYFETPARLFIWGVGIVVAVHFLDVLPIALNMAPEDSLGIVVKLLKVCAVMLVAGLFASILRAGLETEGVRYAKRYTPDFQFDDVLFMSGGRPLSIVIYVMGIAVALQEVGLLTEVLVGYSLAIGTVLVKAFFGVLVSYLLWSQLDFRGKELLNRMLKEREGEVYAKQVAWMYGQATRYVFVVLLVVTVVNALGVDVTAWLAGMSFLGLAVSIAAKDILSNVLSGVMLIIERPFRRGDYIRLESGVEGYVENVSLKFMKLRSPSGELMTVPNSAVTDKLISNQTMASKPSAEMALERRVAMKVGISYDSDPEKAERIIRDILKGNKDVVGSEARPTNVFLVELGDFSLNFELDFWSRSGNVRRAKHEVNTSILRRFKEEGVTIPFPTALHYQVPAKRA